MPDMPRRVLVLSGLQHAGLPEAAMLKPEGSTAHFRVYYDDSLGAGGKILADGVLATAERDYTSLQAWFGGITPGGLPFNVDIIPGSGGASHASCSATTLNCDANYDRDGIPDLVFIKTANTGTGTVEVHIASGASNYQTRILETGTTFGPETDGVWLMADYDRDGIPDLVFIKTANTGTGTVEVHIASGA